MFNIIIVEDEKPASDILVQYLNNYSQSKKQEFNISIYGNAFNFLDNYKADADIVFMDIELPNLDGMKAAELLRERDGEVLLVFITNMQQFAVKGYSVNAMDFIIKPVTYFAFSTMLDKALRIIGTKEELELCVKSHDGMVRLKCSEIKWVEVNKHRLTFHTEQSDFEAWGKLKDVEEKLPKDKFSRCNIGYLVNLSYVKAVEGDDVIVGNDRIKISRPRKRDFLADLAAYSGVR